MTDAMATHKPGFERPSSVAPGRQRRGTIAGTRNAVASAIGVVVLGTICWKLLEWGVLRSVSGTDPEACRGISGACWSVIQARYRIILFGLYPYEQQWRSAVACLIVVATVVAACVPVMWTARRMGMIWLGGYALYLLFMYGGFPGLPKVPTTEWGGLSLTLFIYVTVVTLGFPVAVGLALVRKDSYPAFRLLATVAIDLTRSLPLLTILFSAALILPLVLPAFLQGDKLVRTLAGFVFFFACYQSEIIRGGLQVVPEGQIEAAKALGLNYFQLTTRVVLPQAFRTAAPATISQLVITFKETSLVVIVGLFDLMASANATYQTGVWTPYYKEVYAFVAFIYFLGAFSLSKYGSYIERRLAISTR